MEHEFEDYKEFFSAVGDSYLHPKFCGDCIWPVTIEQMYQAFKERMEAEQAAALKAQGGDSHE